jgi:hypothetical protein
MKRGWLTLAGAVILRSFGAEAAEAAAPAPAPLAPTTVGKAPPPALKRHSGALAGGDVALTVFGGISVASEAHQGWARPWVSVGPGSASIRWAF